MSEQSLGSKISIWRHAWEGNDQNSISNQVLTLVWDAGIFGLINECRRPSEDDDYPKLNGPVQDFISRNFVASQLARMRKLVDQYPLQRTKGARRDNSVFSLRSLVSDISVNRHLMTRGAIFKHQKVNYDLALAEKLEWEEIKQGLDSGAPHIGVQNSAWPTKDLHELWDRLSGCSAAMRSEGDIPSSEVFERMISDLGVVDRARDWATVFVAHAASTTSRQASGKGDIPTWNEIEEMTAAIVRVASAISELIFQTHMAGWLATPQYDLLRNMDHPWCDKARMADLRVWWEQYEERVNSWPNTKKYVEG